MHSFEKFLVALLIALFAVGGMGAAAMILAISSSHDARAQQEDHSVHHDVYRTWCQPGREKPCEPWNSCCNERKEDGSGDCYGTEAELFEGHYRARLWHSQEWIIIPDEKIIHEINPDPTGTRAHLCESGKVVLCFVPPFGGG